MYPLCGVAAVAHAPNHQGRAPDDVAAGEHPRQGGHHAGPVDLDGSPAADLELGRVEQRGRVLGIEAQSLDHQIGIEPEGRARLDLGRLAAGRVRSAKAHAMGPHGLDPAIAQDRLGCGEPYELAPLLLGVGALAQRARHVGAVPPVEASDRRRALPYRRADAIHGGIAATHHDHALAPRVQGSIGKGRHRVAQARAVAGGEVVQRRHDPGQAAARCREVARPVDAGGDEDRVVALAQLAEARAKAANVAGQMEMHAALAQMTRPALDDGLFQLEARNAVDQQAADSVVAIVNVHLTALAPQFLGAGEARWTRADDAHRLRELADRVDRPDPAGVEGGVRYVLLDRPDGHGTVPGLLDHAVAFAQAVLGADA